MFEEIGEKAFNFALFVSVLFTVFGLICVANGIAIPSTYSGLFLPLSTLYGFSENIADAISTLNQTSSGGVLGWLSAGAVVVSLSMSVVGVLFNILFLVLTIFLQILIIMQNIVPPILSFLVLPFGFIAAFLQLSVWIYIAKKMLEKLPFIRVSY